MFKSYNIGVDSFVKIKYGSDIPEKFHPNKYISRQQIKWHEWFTLKTPTIEYILSQNDEITPYSANNSDLNDYLYLMT